VVVLGEKRQCRGKNKHGNPCGRAPLSGQEWCSYHHPDPSVQAEVKRQRRAGGKAHNRASQLKAQGFPSVCIASPADVRAALTDGINRLLTGRIDCKVLNSISHAGRCVLECFRIEDPPPDPGDRLTDLLVEHLMVVPPELRNLTIQRWLMEADGFSLNPSEVEERVAEAEAEKLETQAEYLSSLPAEERAKVVDEAIIGNTVRRIMSELTPAEQGILQEHFTRASEPPAPPQPIPGEPERTCPGCGGKFAPVTPPQKYCNRECKAAHQAGKKAPRTPTPPGPGKAAQKQPGPLVVCPSCGLGHHDKGGPTCPNCRDKGASP